MSDREGLLIPAKSQGQPSNLLGIKSADWSAWREVLYPFFATRLAWVIVALYAAGNFLPNPTYAHYAERGGFLSRFFLLDIWTRWDAVWYLSIARDGYTINPDLNSNFTNLAFFPLYPYLARGLGWLGIPLPDAAYLLTGVLLSNLLFLAACLLLRRMAVEHLGMSAAAARRALLLLFAFPASFFFSCFYTESLFLFLAVAGFAAALDRRWALAGILAALVVLTRPQGVLVAAALGWIYLEARRWQLREIRADLLWLGLAPLALLAHFGTMQMAFGRFLAPIEAQAAWGRGQYSFFEGLWLNLSGPTLDVFKIDALLLLGFLTAGVYLFLRWPQQGRSRAFGLLALLLCLMPLATGSLVSVSRFMAVVFPVFLLLGERLEREETFQLLLVVSFALQIVYFAGWVNYYWIA